MRSRIYAPIWRNTLVRHKLTARTGGMKASESGGDPRTAIRSIPAALRSYTYIYNNV